MFTRSVKRMKQPKGKALSFVLSAALALSLSPLGAAPAHATSDAGAVIDVSDAPAEGASGTGWHYSNGVFIVENGADVKVTGSTASNKIKVTSGAIATVTLDNASIDVSDTGNACAFDMTGATVTLKLSGDNVLKSSGSAAGLQVPKGAQITITSASRDGSLRGSLRADGGLNTSGGGAGIGGCYNGDAGTIIIRGGTINAGAGFVSSYSGAGIGGGHNGSGGKIEISGGSVTASARRYGAGIGGGYYGSGGEITISGGIVTASGGNYGSTIGGAGIGGGGRADVGKVAISGGIVTATGSNVGAGIGSSYESRSDSGEIVISGGVVYATTPGGTGDPAAIGGGGYSRVGKIEITGGTVVAITTNNNSPGIGNGARETQGSIAITGGTVTANGRGIGIGNDNGKTDNTAISENAIVFATNINSAATVTGGTVVTGSAIKITASDDGNKNPAAATAGAITLSGGLSIPDASTWIIPWDWTVNMSDNNLTNAGTIINYGTITGAKTSPTLRKVLFSVVDAGAASDSGISAAYKGISIFSGPEVSEGEDLVITAAANGGAEYYSYAWSDTDNKTPVFTVSGLSAPVNNICTVTGYNISPVLTRGDVNRIDDAKATVTFTSDEAGRYYYAVVPNDANAPDIDTAGAGIQCAANAETAITLSDLTMGVWDIHIRVKDAAGNLSNVLKMDIPQRIDSASVTVGGTYTHTGDALTPKPSDVKVELGGLTLLHGTDYTYAVTEGGTNVGTVTVTVTGIGNYTGTAKGIFTVDAANAEGSGGGGGAAIPKPDTEESEKEDAAESGTGADLPFSDVSAGDWFYDAVRYGTENGLFEGVGAEKFEPLLPLTRAMLVTVLYRQTGTPSVAGLADSFRDTQDGAWYSDAVMWGESEGVAIGYGDGTFRPDNNISRQEMTLILYRYNKFAGGPEGGTAELAFADAGTIAGWAAEGVAWCAANGVVVGRPGNIFDPTAFTTRAEAAVMLQRFREAGFGTAAPEAPEV